MLAKVVLKPEKFMIKSKKTGRYLKNFRDIILMCQKEL